MSRGLCVIRTISLPASVWTTLVLALLCMAAVWADAEESEK